MTKRHDNFLRFTAAVLTIVTAGLTLILVTFLAGFSDADSDARVIGSVWLLAGGFCLVAGQVAVWRKLAGRATYGRSATMITALALLIWLPAVVFLSPIALVFVFLVAMTFLAQAAGELRRTQ